MVFDEHLEKYYARNLCKSGVSFFLGKIRKQQTDYTVPTSLEKQTPLMLARNLFTQLVGQMLNSCNSGERL